MKPIGPLKELTEKFENELFKKALETHGSLADAAHDLGIDISTLTRKNKKYVLTGYTKTRLTLKET